MATVTIIEDNCRSCGKRFRYTFKGTERKHCLECVANAKLPAEKRSVRQNGDNGRRSDGIVRDVLKLSPMESVRKANGRRDAWLEAPTKKERTGGNKTARTAICRVCGVEFSYSSPGRPRATCDEHRTTQTKDSAPKVRQSVCRLCNHEFEYSGRGKLRVICDRERCQQMAKPQSTKKAKEEISADARIDRLMMLLASRGNLLSQQP